MQTFVTLISPNPTSLSLPNSLCLSLQKKLSPMHSHGGATADSGHSSKPKKPKSREVSSRFLSQSPGTATTNDHQYGSNQSPNTASSPLRQKPRSSTSDSRKHNKSLEKSGFLRGLWPSSSPVLSNPKLDSTLADHLGHDRLKDHEEQKLKEKSDQVTPFLLNKQRSCREFGSSFENEKKVTSKENHKPVFGGSTRYTGKYFKFKSSKNYDSLDDQSTNDSGVVPGRFSVDESELRKKHSFVRGLSDSDTQDSGSEYSDICSGGASFETPVGGKYSYMAPTLSSRKHGIEVPSKFMQDLSSRSRRWSADSGINHQKPVASDNNSPKSFTLKKANSKWALSPGRSGSPTALVENKGKMIGSTSSKPPSSPSRGKGVGNFLSMGIELLKGKKSSSGVSSLIGTGSGDSFHQLRLLHNRLMQWRYCDARAEVANRNTIKQVESNFICAWNGLIKLHQSVLQKKIQLQRQKLEMKLNLILMSQMKGLEIWGNMERQHTSAVSSTTDYLHSVVCRIPLVDGAKVEPHSASIVLRNASDLAASINLNLTTFSPTIEQTLRELVDLATIATQEKLLLEECSELFRTISLLEIQERSLQSTIMQKRLLQQ